MIWEGYTRKGLDIKRDDLKFYNVKEKYFKLYGLNDTSISFHRMPDNIAKNVSGAVYDKNREPSGGRIAFTTDSDCVAIRVKLKAWCGAPMITFICGTGFDLYYKDGINQKHVKSFFPALDSITEYEGIYETNNKNIKEFLLYMPLFNEVIELEIGVDNNSKFFKPLKYKTETPVVFYGSSITQGVGASRSAMCYEGIISRKLDCNYLDLGFAGNAMGEIEMAKYISNLNMSAFVFDYDYNAPTVEHLEKTHFAFYHEIRKNNKDIPIIFLSRPTDVYNDDAYNRKIVITNSFLKAINNGDKNVYFIDGEQIFKGDNRDDCSVDGCHPNDLGYLKMANAIADILQNIM